MQEERFPVGQEMDVTYSEFAVHLTLHSEKRMTFEIKDGPYAHAETVAIEVMPLGNGVFAVSWQEESGATVVNIQDFDRNVVHSFVTLHGGDFLRLTGPITVTRPADHASDDRPARNKALVLEAMTALFQRREAAAVERYYAPNYVQHNPNIPQGRDALTAIVAELSADVWYEPGMMVAERDLVAIHGRIAGWGPVPQVVVDLFRVENGLLAEHWDVLQDEVMSPIGGVPMFDPEEAER